MVFVFQVDLTPLPWKSQTYVQNPLFRCLTVTYWVIVWTSFPHPNLMLEAFLVWILVFISCEGSYGQSPTVVSASAFSVNAVSQRFVEGVWDCVRIPACMAVDTCWEWCVVVGLALFSKNETLLRFLLLFFCSLCLFFFFFTWWEMIVNKLKLEKNTQPFFYFCASDAIMSEYMRMALTLELYCALAVVFMGEDLGSQDLSCAHL